MSTDSTSASSAIAAKANAEVFSALDKDGDGSVSKAEFKTAVAGASGESGGTGGPGGPKAAGGGPPPPPPGGAGGDGDGDSSSSASTDPLDTNADGVVSAQEQAAGDLKELMKALTKAADTDGDQAVSASEAEAFANQLKDALTTAGAASTSGSSSNSSGSSSDSSSTAKSNAQDGPGLAQRAERNNLSDMVAQAYSRAAADYAQPTQLSLAA